MKVVGANQALVFDQQEEMNDIRSQMLDAGWVLIKSGLKLQIVRLSMLSLLRRRAFPSRESERDV